MRSLIPSRYLVAIRRGFTMIELLVIIVIMGVLAGVMLPRMSAGGNRRGEVEAESVRVMLSRLGEKDAFSVSPLALIYEGETAMLRMEMRKVDDKEQDVWVKAPLIQPLTLISLKMNATEPPKSTPMNTVG